MIYKKNLKYFIVLIVLLTQFLKLEAQSPWTREKGHAYLQTGSSFLYISRAIVDNQTVTLNKQITDITPQFYGEYGITNNHLVINRYRSKVEYNRIVKSLCDTVGSFLNSSLRTLGGIEEVILDINSFDMELLCDQALQMFVRVLMKLNSSLLHPYHW